jgi:hypothetical protein
MLPFGVTIPATVPQRSEISKGLMNYPVYIDTSNKWIILSLNTNTGMTIPNPSELYKILGLYVLEWLFRCVIPVVFYAN